MRPILVVAATPMLEDAFACAGRNRDLTLHVAPARDVDTTRPAAIGRLLDSCKPWLVVHDLSSHDHDVAFVQTLAEMCSQQSIQLVALSSDQVFDGSKRAPYDESDPPSPRGIRGRALLDAEARSIAGHPDALVIRTGPVFDDSLPDVILDSVSGVLPQGLVSPTYVRDLVDGCLDLAIDGERGIWHLVNGGAWTWTSFRGEVARLTRREVQRDDASRSSSPQTHCALSSKRGDALPDVGDALMRCLRTRSVEAA